MKELVPPLGPEYRRLLEAERTRPPPSRVIQASVAERLAAALADSTGPVRGTEAGIGQPGPEAAAFTGTAGTALHTGARLTWTQIAPALVAAFLLGGALGAWLAPLGMRRAPAPSLPPGSTSSSVFAQEVTGAVLRDAVSHESLPSPSVASASALRSASSNSGGAAALPTTRRAVVKSSGARAVAAAERASPAVTERASPRPTRLAEERALLDSARSALARGNVSAALQVLARYDQQFPRGQLVEESAALAVQALASAGRLPEAGEHAGRFRLRYPKSLLLPMVNDAVGAR